MDIMCLNGWGGALHGEILPYLAASAPDVLCLQEVVHTPASPKDWLTYRDETRELPQRANFFRDVCAALPEHRAIYCPAAQGVLWDGDTAIPSQWGLATFVRADFPVIGQIQRFVHKAFSPDGYGAHPRPRAVHGVRLYDFAQARTISLTQMHGMWDPRGKIDTPERTAQAHGLIKAAQDLAEPGDIVVICGDFNVEPESETLRLLTATGLTELVTSRGFAGTRSSHYTKPRKFADYMLISDEALVDAFEVVRAPEVSDHCPLVLQL